MTENQQKERLKRTKEKTYNLKNDVIFQTFFARKGNEEFLIDFLNGLLKKDIKQVIMINILGYNFLDVEDYISETAIVLEKHREYEVLTGIKWYFIELPKFRKAHPNMDEKLNQWLAFIDDNDRGKIKMAEKKNKTLEKARKEMTYLTGDEEIRRLAELREKWEMDWNSSMDYSKKEGINEGRKKERLENAKKMKEEKIPIETIEKITGLSKKEIENL